MTSSTMGHVFTCRAQCAGWSSSGAVYSRAMTLSIVAIDCIEVLANATIHPVQRLLTAVGCNLDTDGLYCTTNNKQLMCIEIIIQNNEYTYRVLYIVYS